MQISCIKVYQYHTMWDTNLAKRSLEYSSSVALSSQIVSQALLGMLVQRCVLLGDRPITISRSGQGSLGHPASLSHHRRRICRAQRMLLAAQSMLLAAKTSTACGELAHAVPECVGGTLGEGGRRRTLHSQS